MNRLTYIGLAIAAVFILTAIFAPLIATHDTTCLLYTSDAADE